MEGILKFNLDNHEDTQSHMRAIKSNDMAIVLFELHYNLRKKIINNNNIIDMKTLNIVFDEIDNLM